MRRWLKSARASSQLQTVNDIVDALHRHIDPSYHGANSRQQLNTLRQGTMTISQYQLLFIDLVARVNEVPVASEPMLAREINFFINGLRSEFLQQVARSHVSATFATVVQALTLAEGLKLMEASTENTKPPRKLLAPI